MALLPKANDYYIIVTCPEVVTISDNNCTLLSRKTVGEVATAAAVFLHSTVVWNQNATISAEIVCFGWYGGKSIWSRNGFGKIIDHRNVIRSTTTTRTWDARAMDMEKADNLERAVSFLIVSGERHLAPGERRLQLLEVPVDHALVDVLYLLLQWEMDTTFRLRILRSSAPWSLNPCVRVRANP